MLTQPLCVAEGKGPWRKKGRHEVDRSVNVVEWRRKREDRETDKSRHNAYGWYAGRGVRTFPFSLLKQYRTQPTDKACLCLGNWGDGQRVDRRA